MAVGLGVLNLWQGSADYLVKELMYLRVEVLAGMRVRVGEPDIGA